MHHWEAFVPHVMAFMPLRDVTVAFRVNLTKIVPHKICCASPSGGQEATLSDTLLYTTTVIPVRKADKGAV